IGPFFDGISTGMISSLNRPAFCAASVLFWLFTANSSCSSRVTAYSLATFSAVTPMWYWLNTSHSPSTIMVSTIFASPMRKPSREPLSACGERLIDSWPPATTRSESPLAIACAPSIAACRPEPQTLLMVIAGTMYWMPALIAAWRAELGGRRLGEAAAELADRGAGCADDDDLFHEALLVDSLLHVAAGGRFDGSVLDISGRRRCGPLAAAVPREPLRPRRPPAAPIFSRDLKEVLGLGRVTLRSPVAAAVLRRRIDHAGDVAARAEHEPFVLSSQQLQRPVSGAPGDDVVFARREHEKRQLDRAEIDRHAAIGERAGLAQLVGKIRVAQVVAVHRTRQVGAVGVPVEDVERRRGLAQEIVVDYVRPDEIVRAQAGENEGEVRSRQDPVLADGRLARRNHGFGARGDHRRGRDPA